jgi:outer membrane biosynthesis protein TonB
VDCVKLICDLRLISALVVTPVGAYFLWPSSHGDAGHHGHDEHHEEHHEEAEAKEEEAPQEEESKDDEPKEEESKDEEPKDKEPEKSDKPSGTEGDSQPRADANKKSSGKEEAEERAPTSGPASTEGASGKGQMKNDSEGMNQSSKREPDGKVRDQRVEPEMMSGTSS